MKEGGKKRGGVGLDFQKRESVCLWRWQWLPCAQWWPLVAVPPQNSVPPGLKLHVDPSSFQSRERRRKRERGGEKENFFSEIGGEKGEKFTCSKKKTPRGRSDPVFSHTPQSVRRDVAQRLLWIVCLSWGDAVVLFLFH